MKSHILLYALVFIVTGRIRIASAIGATMGQLSSIHTNREKVCPGEIVSYRCTTNGSLLAWALPPLDISNLIVFNHNSPPESVISRVQGKVLAVLVTGAPVFESFLIIKPIFNVSFINVTCILGDNSTQLSKVYSIATKPSTVTGVEVGLNTISWTAPSMLVDLEFYELHAIGRSASSENRTFRVLETFASISTTSFEAVSITVQNRCGQQSEAVILPFTSCAMTCTATRVASTFAVLFLGVLLTVVPCIVAHSSWRNTPNTIRQ